MGKIYKNGIEYGGGGGGDSAGHIILDNDGTAMAEEPNLQFIGLDVTDNSTDGVTEVESAGLNSDSLDDITNGSIGNEVISNGLVYSTNEQVVGKWIDGKPIYQKTIQTTFSNTTSAKSILDITGLNVIRLSQYRAGWGPGNGTISGYIFDSRTVTDIDFYTQGNTLYVQNNEEAFFGMPIIATIQYTKTTD